jgi:hypothetical protein
VLTIGEDDGLSRTFAIMERGNPVGPVWWRVLKDMQWLTLNVTIGSGPKKVTATANPAGLAPGTYMGTLIVEADANDSPQFVQITFKVLP